MSQDASFCAACGAERDEGDHGDHKTCPACGFAWTDIELAERIARAVLRKLGLGEEELRDVIDAVLGETTEP